MNAEEKEIARLREDLLTACDLLETYALPHDGPEKEVAYIIGRGRKSALSGDAAPSGSPSVRRPIMKADYWAQEYQKLGRIIHSQRKKIEELVEALRDMIKTFENVPEMAQACFDEPPEPKTEWDYRAFQTLHHANEELTKFNNEGKTND